MSMSRKAMILQEGVNAAAQAMIAVARELGFEIPAPTILAQAAAESFVRHYVPAERTRLVGHYSKNTRTLAQMEVGDTAILPPIARPTVDGRIASARVLMNNPDAVWTSEHLPTGEWKVTRLPDGAAKPRVITSPITAELVELKPGQSRISHAIRSIRGTGALMTSHRYSARVHLGEPEANWTTRATNRGIRLTRVA